MKKVFCLTLAAALLLGSISACAQEDEVKKITIDPAKASQVNDGFFEGWGTSLCWWANRVGYSDVLSEKAAEAFCDPEKGLGLNILRYNIGGGDDPSHDHITRTDSMMPGFWANPQVGEETGEYSWDYDWSQDYNQRNVLQKCLETYGEDLIVEGFSNSPPYFMTNSGCSSGSKLGFNDNLKKDAYAAFAAYLADVALHFSEEWGITFQSMTPMNEPYTDYWRADSPKQEGCHFDRGASESDILVELSKALKERGLEDIILSGTDETSIDVAATCFSMLTPEAVDAISRIDTHSYGGSAREFLRNMALNAGKNLWMSEVDGGDTLGENAGEMGAGLWLAKRIIDDMNGLTPAAWILWQVIDSHICEEGYLGRKDTGMVNVDGGYWGTAVADHDKEEIILTQKYYVFGQFTRYIRPGCTIIAGDDYTLAAYDPQKNELVIVAMNKEQEDAEVFFDLSGFSPEALRVAASTESSAEAKKGDGKGVPEGCPVRVIRTSGSLEDGEQWAEAESLKTAEGGLAASLKGQSVTTYRIDLSEGDNIE